MMKLIDADKLKSKLNTANMFGHNQDIPDYVFEIIDEMPDSARHGHWTDLNFQSETKHSRPMQCSYCIIKRWWSCLTMNNVKEVRDLCQTCFEDYRSFAKKRRRGDGLNQ